MYPILFEYKTLQISTYGLMLMIAFLLCNYLLRKYLLSIDKDPKIGDDIIFYAAFGGILGSQGSREKIPIKLAIHFLIKSP